MDTLPDVNLLILGAAGVGKTTFVQNALELAAPPSSHIVAKNINIEGRPCVVRLIELPIEDVEIKEDNAITWPSTVDGARIPRVDGVLTLYDISDKASFEDVPETLSKIPLLFTPCFVFTDVEPWLWPSSPIRLSFGMSGHSLHLASHIGLQNVAHGNLHVI